MALTSVQNVLEQARDALTVRRVFGDPYERDGIVVIPAAAVRGGAGGGGGQEAGREGAGGGFGVTARPVGAFLIKGGEVAWQPSLDLNRAILGGQIVALVAILAWRSVAKARQKARRAASRG